MSGADLNSALSDKAKRVALIRDQNVAALQREHAAMSRHGKTERAGLVAAELKKLGVDVKPEPEAAPASEDVEPDSTPPENGEVDLTAEPEAAPAQPVRKRTQTRA